MLNMVPLFGPVCLQLVPMASNPKVGTVLHPGTVSTPGSMLMTWWLMQHGHNTDPSRNVPSKLVCCCPGAIFRSHTYYTTGLTQLLLLLAHLLVPCPPGPWAWPCLAAQEA